MNTDNNLSTVKILLIVLGAFLFGMIIVPKSKTETITKEIPKEIRVNICDHDAVWLKIKSIDEKLYRNTSYRIEYSNRIVRASLEEGNRNLEAYRSQLNSIVREDDDLWLQRIDLLKQIGY